MQTWNPEQYARDAGYVAELGAGVVDLLDPQSGERVLDLGCGDGALTVKIVERGAEVVGVDGSPDMVAAAKERGLDARLADGHDLSFDTEFDAVFSNAALHWMQRPDDVIAGVARALRGGGRFVAEMGGHGNTAAVTTAILATQSRRGIDGVALLPWYFPSADDYTARLERGGFSVEEIVLFPRPTPIPGDIGTWLDVFGGSVFAGISDVEAAKAEITELLRPSLCDEAGRWHVDHVRLRFCARLRG